MNKNIRNAMFDSLPKFIGDALYHKTYGKEKAQSERLTSKATSCVDDSAGSGASDTSDTPMSP